MVHLLEFKTTYPTKPPLPAPLHFQCSGAFFISPYLARMLILDSHLAKEVKPDNIRFSDYAVGIFQGLPSRKSVKKAIKAGALLLNGEQVESGRHVKAGDRIEWLDLPREQRSVYPMLLKVIYEDDDLAIIHKPAGIPVNGNSFRNIDNALPYNLQMPATEQGMVLPVHRLDQATSGLLVVGKNRKAVIHLANQFAEGKIRKVYHALVDGLCAQTGAMHVRIDGKKSESQYESLEQIHTIHGNGLSLLRVFPKTGRKHQIRIHLAKSGHPILGDDLYNAAGKTYKGKGLFLAATGLDLVHPRTQEKMHFEIPVPNKFSAMMAYQKRRAAHQVSSASGATGAD